MRLQFTELKTFGEQMLAKGLLAHLREQGLDIEEGAPVAAPVLANVGPAVELPAGLVRPAGVKSKNAPKKQRPTKHARPVRQSKTVPLPKSGELSADRESRRGLIRSAFAAGRELTGDQFVALVESKFPGTPRNSTLTQLLQLSKQGECELSDAGIWRAWRR